MILMNTLGLNPNSNFYLNDYSSLRFEKDYHGLITLPFPSWSLEPRFIDYMKQNGPALYFKPNETNDGKQHVFQFVLVKDDDGIEWYSYVGYH